MMYQVMVGYILRTDILIIVAHTFIALNYVPYTLLNALHVLTHLTLTTMLWGKYIIIPILLMKELNHRQVKWPAQSHTGYTF